MSIEEMARIALAILWGGALCGLGVAGLDSLLRATSSKPEESPWGTNGRQLAAFVFVATFVAALLYALSIADVFHFWDWLRHRPR
jgi:hypothetical protein